MTQLPGPHRRTTLAVGAAVALSLGLAACGESSEEVTIGLITKQEENPYWVTMREVAQDVAGDNNVELLTATGESDVDVESQIEALERMTAEEVDGILIAPTDSQALVPAIEQAREAGILVIAVDTPTDPVDAVDAFFTTDNRRAGEIIGEYARARADEEGLEPRIAMLDLAPGIRSGEERHEGFLEGFGIEEGAEQIVAMADTEGDEDLARDAMAELLETNPDVNVVYTVNEPAALGAVAALRAAGTLDDVIVVSVDGGCEAIKNGVRPGDIDATAQQFPENMAREGVRRVAEAVRGENDPPSGYLDTGLRLITGSPVSGVESEDVAFGVRNCWG